MLTGLAHGTTASETLAQHWIYQGNLPLCAVFTEYGVMRAYGISPDPTTLAEWYVKVGRFHAGLPLPTLGRALEVGGLPVVRRSFRSLRDLEPDIRKGHAVIAIVNTGALWYADDPDTAKFQTDLVRVVGPYHVVWVTDLLDDRVYFNDTAQPAGAGLSVDRRAFDTAWSEAGRSAVLVPKLLPPLDPDGDGAPFIDADEDGFATIASGGNDCDDRNPRIHPHAFDVPYNEVDEDCAGGDRVDFDGDGVPFDPTRDPRWRFDCDDNEPLVTFSVAWEDRDGDGFGTGYGLTVCSDTIGTERLVDRGGDCDDANPGAHPDRIDYALDGVDSNCDGDDEPDSTLGAHRISEWDGSSIVGQVSLTWECTCGRTFDSKPLARLHADEKEILAADLELRRLRSVHRIDGRRTCACGRRFATEAAFARHLSDHVER